MTIAEPLPIDAVLPQLTAALADNPFAVLVAAPGAGKTTRVPLALLDSDWRGDGRIIMLEPRRLAARAAARRMAATLGEAVGETVGYRVRMDTRIGPRTRIEVVTEGIFTRMLLDDPGLSGIAAVLFDEFHERSLDGDLGLALALDAMALRPDLRLVIMSATLDASRVATLMHGAPVIVSEGRLFPVETRYQPARPDARLETEVAAVVGQSLAAGEGSFLVFLPGEAEIRRVEAALRRAVDPAVEIAPLYGRLPAEDQDRAIAAAPPGRVKVVLATAIAETSLTIEGIRVVVDAGLSRGPSFEPATALTRLVTRKVSQAAAEQRRGRAGRMAPGICYRLWSAAEQAALLPFDRPEIVDADLTGLVLDLANWGVVDPAALRFLDPPPRGAWMEASNLLRLLQAIDGDGRITTAGKGLARLPLHPRLAHMIACAAAEGEALVAAEIAVLVSEVGLGGKAVDLEQRRREFGMARDARSSEARALARRWAGLAGSRGATESGHGAGWHLARAYPDRVAQAAGRPGRFRLANGRAAELDPAEPLAGAPFLVVADLSGGAATGRIRSAAAIGREDIEALFASAITEETSLAFDQGSRSVRARRLRRLGQVRLADAPVAISDPARAALLLAKAIGSLGVGVLPWSREQQAWRARTGYLHGVVGAPWPDLSDATLAGTTPAWLAPHIHGRSAVAEITADDLGAALAELLPWSLRAELDRLLPSHFAAPSGQRHAIDYAAENGPALSIRVQELFGLGQHPTVAGGRVPLLLVLLSPAHRPIQTTRDLPGFWAGSWQDVAKDLRGRYPRHFWPADPANAEATARAKPHGT